MSGPLVLRTAARCECIASDGHHPVTSSGSRSIPEQGSVRPVGRPDLSKSEQVRTAIRSLSVRQYRFLGSGVLSRFCPPDQSGPAMNHLRGAEPARCFSVGTTAPAYKACAATAMSDKMKL